MTIDDSLMLNMVDFRFARTYGQTKLVVKSLSQLKNIEGLLNISKRCQNDEENYFSDASMSNFWTWFTDLHYLIDKAKHPRTFLVNHQTNNLGFQK